MSLEQRQKYPCRYSEGLIWLLHGDNKVITNALKENYDRHGIATLIPYTAFYISNYFWQ